MPLHEKSHRFPTMAAVHNVIYFIIIIYDGKTLAGD
jgi:hypothetical protein